MEKFKDVAEYLKQDISTRDFDKGLELYRIYYGNNQYSKSLERKRNAKDLEWKLESVLRKNGLSLKDFPDAETSGATGKADENSGVAGASGSFEISDEVNAYIQAQTELANAIYKETGADQSVLAELANALESGETSARLQELAASIDAAFTDKLQVHWDNIDYARANNAIPVASDEKKEAAIDVSALKDVELLKKRANASSAVSKYTKANNEEMLAKHKPLLEALDAEIKKRDLKA